MDAELDMVEALRPRDRSEAADACLRQAVLRQTTNVIRRRRRARRGLLGLALACCYVGGLATPHLGMSQPVRVAQTPAPQQVAPVTKKVCTQPTEPRKTRFEVYRAISDEYLYEDGDVEWAIRYYNRALDAATAKEMEISPEHDSWLLMALKQERMRRENFHDNSDT